MVRVRNIYINSNLYIKQEIQIFFFTRFNEFFVKIRKYKKHLYEEGNYLWI